MQNEVTAWLDGDRDYEQGFQLLKTCGASTLLIDLLSDGPGAYNTSKLHAELVKISQAKSEDTEPASEASPEPTARVQIDDEPANQGRNVEKKLRIDRIIKTLWKEICHLHGQLSVLPEGEELHRCAREILTKNLKRQDLWDQLHYFEANGGWFDDLPENQPKPENAEQGIKNLMACRSKARRELKKPLSVAKREHHLRRIAEFNKQIEALKLSRKII